MSKAVAKPVDADLLEWPDLAFHHYCLRFYHLNRGVYNTVDQWLYENGYSEIKRRRKAILSFLEQMAAQYRTDDGTKFLSFGKGNLIAELMRFTGSITSHETKRRGNEYGISQIWKNGTESIGR